MRALLILLIIGCCVALTTLTKDKNSLAIAIGGAGFVFFLLLLFFLRTKQCSRCRRKGPIDAWGWKRKAREGDPEKKFDLFCPNCWHEQTADSEERVRDWVPKRNDAQLTQTVRESFARFKSGECFSVNLERSVEWHGIYLTQDLLQELANCPDTEGIWQPANASGDTATITKPYSCEQVRTAARWAIRQQEKYAAAAKKLRLLE